MWRARQNKRSSAIYACSSKEYSPWTDKLTTLKWDDGVSCQDPKGKNVENWPREKESTKETRINYRTETKSWGLASKGKGDARWVRRWCQRHELKASVLKSSHHQRQTDWGKQIIRAIVLIRAETTRLNDGNWTVETNQRRRGKRREKGCCKEKRPGRSGRLNCREISN